MTSLFAFKQEPVLLLLQAKKETEVHAVWQKHGLFEDSLMQGRCTLLSGKQALKDTSKPAHSDNFQSCMIPHRLDTTSGNQSQVGEWERGEIATCDALLLSDDRGCR